MATISSVRALEILDSRGNPTLRVTVTLNDGARGEASVPAGASTGSHEAVELRDGDMARYGGKGVAAAVGHVEAEIGPALKRRGAHAQERVDQTLRELDGTEQKKRLGANALLGVSLAVACAAAVSARLPLYAYLRRLIGKGEKAEYVLPVPLLNLINGGRHADSGLDIQEFLIVPSGASSFAEAVRAGSEIFHALGDLLHTRGFSRSVGDEGGYAPALARNDEVFALLQRAVEATKRTVGTDIVFGIDAAASEFYVKKERAYALSAPAVTLPTDRLLALYAEWVKAWPLRTIEDPLHEDDWDGWAKGTEKLRTLGVQVVGDDFFVTNVERLTRGLERKCATAILVKPNQIGTLSETLQAIDQAQRHNYGVIISHRSGETADTFIADLAVATDAGQIKTGGVTRSERVEKFNRLLAIERELGSQASFAGATAFRP